MTTALSDRFWAKVSKQESGCWEWTGAKTNGYGVIGVRRNTIEKAHRISYMIHKGDFQQAMCVCHVCDNPGCVNPEHLFIGTHRDNAADRDAKGRAVQKPVRGEDQGLAKLTENSVRRIRIVAGAMSLQKLADLFGVSKKSILNVVQRKTWSHVK
jgi:hypothetical protein